MKLLSKNAISRQSQAMIWTGLAYAIAMIFSEKWWLLETLSNGRLMVFWVVLLGSALSLVVLSPIRMILGLIVCAWLAWPALPYYGLGKLAIVKSEEPTPTKEESVPFKVLCFNIGPDNAPLANLISTLENTPSKDRPDCIFLMEIRTEPYREHYNALRRLYPHHISEAREDNFGVWLISKHPFKKTRSVRREERMQIGEIPLLDVELDVDGSPVRLFGLHPLPPISREAAKTRAAYFDIVKKRSADETSTMIVMGDFNTAKWSPVYKDFSAALKMQSAAYGYGLDLTWKPIAQVPLLGLPIDHILVTSDILVEDFKVGAADGSDHRPLFAVLRLPAES